MAIGLEHSLIAGPHVQGAAGAVRDPKITAVNVEADLPDHGVTQAHPSEHRKVVEAEIAEAAEEWLRREITANVERQSTTSHEHGVR